jgi:hypothetical protein
LGIIQKETWKKNKTDRHQGSREFKDCGNPKKGFEFVCESSHDEKKIPIGVLVAFVQPAL